MKFINRLSNKGFSLLSILFCVAVACSSCGEDNDVNPGGVDPDKSVPDPTGTITLAMRDYDNGDIRIDHIYIKKENFTNSYDGYFASIGAVKGLGNVADIPTAGWAEKVAVIPGSGYVAYDDYRKKFYRIYVNDYLSNTMGGIIGAEIKYQEPFKGKDETISFDVKSLAIPAEGGVQTLTFKNQGVILFDVESDIFTVEKASTNDRPFLTNAIAITATRNSSSQPREGTITLTTLHGKKTVLKVTQAGTEPFISFGNANLNLSAAEQVETVSLFGNIAFSDLSVSGSEAWCQAELVETGSRMQANSKVKYIGNKAAEDIDLGESMSTSGSLKLTVAENATPTSRNATITVKSKDGKASATLNVVQSGITFEVKSDKIGFDKNANYRTLTINTTVKEWEAESSADWCTFSKNGNQITIRATESTEDRTAVVSFKGFDTKITVHQSKYAVGDSFSEDGIEGTVGYIGDEARYIYKSLGTSAWSTESVETGANSKDDGEYNMNVIKKIPFWEDSYPAFLLCEQLNTDGVTGWYMPAQNELFLLSGGLYGNSSRGAWSSTEYDMNCAYSRHVNYNTQIYYDRKTYSWFNVIAIHKF